MNERQPSLFSYIVAADHGFAPNPFGGICTLSCYKPRLRHNANYHDWVIGTAPPSTKERLIYAMQVERALTFDIYWNSKEYELKKPGKTNGCGDNIYHEGLKGEFIQEPSIFRTSHDVKKDTSVNRVLIAKTFYYFGQEAPVIPKKFNAILQTVVQGHKRIKPDTAQYGLVTAFLLWLQENFQPGIHGDPAQVKEKCKLPADAFSNISGIS